MDERIDLLGTIGKVTTSSTKMGSQLTFTLELDMDDVYEAWAVGKTTQLVEKDVLVTIQERRGQ